VQSTVTDLVAEANSSNDNIIKGLKNLQKMLTKTGQGLELGSKQVEREAIAAENALS